MNNDVYKLLLEQIETIIEASKTPKKKKNITSKEFVDIFLEYTGRQNGLQYDVVASRGTVKASTIRNTNILTEEQIELKFNSFISAIKKAVTQDESSLQTEKLIKAIYTVINERNEISWILTELSSYSIKIDHTSNINTNTTNPRLHVFKHDKQIRTVLIQQIVKINDDGMIIPSTAADYQMGVCVQFNKHVRNLSLQESINKANISPNRIYAIKALQDFFETSITKDSLKLIEANTILRMANGQSPVSEWPGSNQTPKTDITSADLKYRYSIKKRGKSSNEFQLASGLKDQTIGLLNSGKFYYDKLYKDSGYYGDLVKKITNTIQKQFKAFNIPNITLYKNQILQSYYDIRFKMINKVDSYSLDQLSKKDIKIAKTLYIDKQRVLSSDTQDMTNILKYQFRRQFSDFRLWTDENKYNAFQGFDIPKISKDEFLNIVERILTEIYTSDVIEQLKSLFQASLSFAMINQQFSKLLNTSEFKFGIVFQAATGLYKFGGKSAITATSPSGLISDLNGAPEAVANYFLVLDNDGSPIKATSITPKQINALSGNVKVDVSFKTAGKTTNISTRIIASSISDEIKKQFKMQTESIIKQYCTTMCRINESFFDIKKIINSGKDFMSQIIKVIVEFFNKIKNNIGNDLELLFSSGLIVAMDELGLSLEGSTITGLDIYNV